MFTDDLDRRFRDFDADFQVKLKDAMKWEDKTLLQYIERNQLSKWVSATLDTARAEIQNEADDAAQADVDVPVKDP